MFGVVKNIKADRGFGFIMPDGCREREDSHWFHAKNLIGVPFDERLQGQRVEFDSVNNAKGLVAEYVRLAERVA